MVLTKKQIETVIKNASQALAKYCMEAGIHNTVTGISGGLDSAVTLALAGKAAEYAYKKGFVIKNIGLILPCQSDPKHAVLAKKVIKKFNAELIEIDLSKVFENIDKSVLKPLSDELLEYHLDEHKFKYRTSRGNIKARLRMALGTYFVANMVNGLVLSTDNYSEYWLGFWTLHGDVGDFGMIQGLWKGTELIQIAEYLGVAREVISAAPTDGLDILPGGDEAQIGAPYDVVDRVLREAMRRGIELNGSIVQLKKIPPVKGVDQETVLKILKRSLGNSFKRKNPLNL